MATTEKNWSNHWGTWLLERSRYIGFRRNLDLASTVGCSQNQLSKWMQMREPPVRVLKGLDQRLAFALETTRSALFTEWFIQPPKEVKRTIFHVDQLPDVEERTWNPDLLNVGRKILGGLPSSQLERILQIAVIIGADHPTDDLKMIAERFAQLRKFQETGEQAPAMSPELAYPKTTQRRK